MSSALCSSVKRIHLLSQLTRSIFISSENPGGDRETAIKGPEEFHSGKQPWIIR